MTMDTEHYADVGEQLSALRTLIDQWCERRSLRVLSFALPGYFGLNGLTDGWAGLEQSLRNVRAFARDELTEPELDRVNALIRAVEKLVHR